MVRFLCFYPRISHHKPKKTGRLSMESMHKPLQSNKEFTSAEQVSEDSKTQQSKPVNKTENNKGPDPMVQMRKSMSLGSDLIDYENRTNGYSIDDEYATSHNTRTESVVEFTDKEPSTSFYDENQNPQTSGSLQVSSNLVNHESVFSVGYQQSDEEVCENCDSRSPESYVRDFPHSIIKSNSSPFLDNPFSESVHQSRSSDDLKAFERVDDNVTHVERSTGDSSDSYNYGGSAKDWIVPGGDESGKGKNNVQGDHLVSQWDGLANKDFKIKRIEKWVMDLHSTPLNDPNAPMNPDPLEKNDQVLDGLAAPRIDAKAYPGLDAAKRYISSLSGLSSAAHLANHGLVAIPYLSPFVSLKEVNLSGNAIVRITTGVLPRGLHILNLSKNSISVIEGLRELTRLRALDLSYNRILRIGHGLASCLLLKELYLAGNKISEVEGLHRLLKLKVLDLRFNKLSTTKSLGQLAANYSSLQAIGLEGNPAQKNLGDEHLKKYVIGLLPNLAYYNRHSVRSSLIKDPINPAAQLGFFDRDRARKSTHGRKSQTTSSRGRHVRLPPSGMKTMPVRHHAHDSSSRRPALGSEVVIRRTRSEGVLLDIRT